MNTDTERAAFLAWAADCGCDTDGAWSAWQARAKLAEAPTEQWLKEAERLAVAYGGAEYTFGMNDGDPAWSDETGTKADAARAALLSHLRLRPQAQAVAPTKMSDVLRPFGDPEAGALFAEACDLGRAMSKATGTVQAQAVAPKDEPVAWMAEDGSGYRGLTFIDPQPPRARATASRLRRSTSTPQCRRNSPRKDRIMADQPTREQVLEGALRSLIRGYINVLENGRDRILYLGGQCDPLDKMEASDPNLREARNALAYGVETSAVWAKQYDDGTWAACRGSEVITAPTYPTAEAAIAAAGVSPPDGEGISRTGAASKTHRAAGGDVGFALVPLDAPESLRGQLCGYGADLGYMHPRDRAVILERGAVRWTEILRWAGASTLLAASTVEGQGDTWLPSETLPKEPPQWIQVQTTELYRWLPYKGNSQEFKRGIRGRWQKHDGYGFKNCEEPSGPWRIGEMVSSTPAPKD